MGECSTSLWLLLSELFAVLSIIAFPACAAFWSVVGFMMDG